MTSARLTRSGIRLEFMTSARLTIEVLLMTRADSPIRDAEFVANAAVLVAVSGLPGKGQTVRRSPAFATMFAPDTQSLTEIARTLEELIQAYPEHRSTLRALTVALFD